MIIYIMYIMIYRRIGSIKLVALFEISSANGSLYSWGLFIHGVM